MAKEYFVLGIGGTGMRCIESLIHMCAMGMFDDTNIHLLALDTDKNNGNFGRLKELKEAYVNSKDLKPENRVALKDTFFSANIKYYEFSPNYETSSTFKKMFEYGDTQYNHREETDLADLMFDQNVEEFNLQHGYRAQTHLGSMMMYQSIVEAARSPLPNGIKDFVSTLITATTAGKAKVFILGSVFGGTGASSIPIIPQALSHAAQIISNNADILKNAYFGATLLTAYFNFTLPDASQLTQQQVIATSDKFALNSQVAMMFYDDDASVHSTYQRFYMMGTDKQDWNPMIRQNDTGKTLTGGAAQKNDSHFIELLAASAAYDFFLLDEAQLQTNKEHKTTDYVYRAIDDSGKFDFQDFVGKERQEEFAKKFGMLIVFGLFNNGGDNIVEAARSGLDKQVVGYETIDSSQVDYLKKYFRLLINRMVEDEHLEEGWVRQIHRSAGGGDYFLFCPKLFSPQTMNELKKLDWNKYLYRGEGIGRDKNYSTGILGFGSKFDPFKREWLKRLHSSTSSNITNPGEQLYKTIYDTLCKLYKFN